MYKIFIKIQNDNKNIFRYDAYTTENSDGDKIEYQSESLPEIEAKVKELMNKKYSANAIKVVKIVESDFTVTLTDATEEPDIPPIPDTP